MNRRTFVQLAGLASSSVLAIGCASSPKSVGSTPKPRDERDARGEPVFTKADRQGTFVLFDERRNVLTIVGQNADMAHSPASTFKIPNSLIALETGVAPDETFTLPWDGKERTIDLGAGPVPMSDWNRDQDMRSAMKVSCVWYYQEIARRVGQARMQEKVDAFGYGNRDIGGGIDRFWLDGALRITPRQQVAFLRKLWRNELPVRRENMERVRRLIVLEEKDGRTLFGKTGLTDAPDGTTGWLVGTVQKPAGRWHYALVLNGNGQKPVMKLRRPMVEELLAAYDV